MTRKQMQQDKDKREWYYRQRKDDYEKVFSSEAGKRVLEDLSRSCFMKQTTFNSDPYVMACNEGMRRVYLHIKSMSEPKEDNQPKRSIK